MIRFACWCDAAVITQARMCHMIVEETFGSVWDHYLQSLRIHRNYAARASSELMEVVMQHLKKWLVEILWVSYYVMKALSLTSPSVFVCFLFEKFISGCSIHHRAPEEVTPDCGHQTLLLITTFKLTFQSNLDVYILILFPLYCVEKHLSQASLHSGLDKVLLILTCQVGMDNFGFQEGHMRLTSPEDQIVI